MSDAEELHKKYPQVDIDEIAHLLRISPKKDAEKRLAKKYGPPQVPLTHDEKVAKLAKEFSFLPKKEIEDILNKYLDNLENARDKIKENMAFKELLQKCESKEEEEEEEEEEEATMTEDEIKKQMSKDKDKGTCLFDLHRYSLKSAKRLMNDIFNILKNGEYKRADIITGRGKHSPDGIAHIRAFVVTTAVNIFRWRAEINKDNTGIVSIYPNEKVPDDFYIDENEVFYGI